jgi:hypothetical protein
VLLNRHRLVVLAAGALALAGLAAFWWTRPGVVAPEATPRLPPAEDPRLTIATPFLNVRPEVRYVGDEACAGCHRALTNSYHQHPMARSLAPAAKASALERYDTNAHNPFEAQGFLYRVDRQGERIFHHQTAAAGGVQAEAEIAFAVGSGRRGRAYLIEHDGYLFQSPITWYPLKGIWDLSPGYDEANPHFSRPIIADCLFCHCNQAEPDRHAANRYQPPLFRGHAIGCERCHGPGELHVQRRRAGSDEAGMEVTIVNPRHLDHALREAICQQCHLQGEVRVLPRGRAYFEYRPGLPLHRFVADFVRPADQRPDNKFVGTVEQMVASRCYQKSRGPDQLGCISCHDPHALPAPEQRVGFYRDRCQKCHADLACSLPRPARLEKSPEDSCIHCHMPTRSGSILHTAITDHSIPRRGDGPGAAPKAGDWPRPGQMPLLPFPPEQPDVPDTDQDRNLGLALVEVARKQPGGAASRLLADRALPILEAAAAGDPRDGAAWEARATALLLLGRPEAALATCAAALNEDPQRETTLFLAAALATQLQRSAEARTYAERAIRVNPWLWQYRHMLAEAYAQEDAWEKAAEACRDALQLQPANLPSRQLLLRAYLQLGDKSRARGELDACLALLPPLQRNGFRRWFEQQR